VTRLADFGFNISSEIIRSWSVMRDKRYKERSTIICQGFKIDFTRVTSDKQVKVYYEIELEILDDTCDLSGL